MVHFEDEKTLSIGLFQKVRLFKSGRKKVFIGKIITWKKKLPTEPLP